MNTISPNTETRVGRMFDGGRVTVTFTSPTTGEHITVTAKCRAPQENGKWSHATLSEARVIFFEVPNQDGFNDKIGKYSDGKGFTPDPRADRARVFCAEMLLRLVQGLDLPTGLAAAEESRCGCCGRPLTDPVSIERGIGPECFGAATGSLHQTKNKAREAAQDAEQAAEIAAENAGVIAAERDAENAAQLDRDADMDDAIPADLNEQWAAHNAQANGDGLDKNGVAYGYGDWKARKAVVTRKQKSENPVRPSTADQSDFGGKPGDDGSLHFFMTGEREPVAA